ncbi:MAG: hypothetical protein ACT4NU_01005 [Chromatiales bacterium]
MNGRFGHSALTVLLGAGSATFASHATAGPVHPTVYRPPTEVADVPTTHGSAVARDACIFMERDITAQATWLTQQASVNGYTDLHELLVNAPHLYTRLAEVWRLEHPLPMAA